MSADLPILQFFRHDHLPPHLAEVSAPFKVLAEKVAELPRNAESSTALRKLLEAKDAAVRSVIAVALLACLLPSVALAADGGTFLGGLLGGLLTPENIGLAVGAILTLVGGYLARLVTTNVRKRNVAIAIRHGYLAVEEIARLDTHGTLADKVAAGLREVDTWMVAQGWRPLTEGEKQVARLGFTAISGEAHQAAKIAAKAAQLGGAAAVPTAPLAS